MGFYNNTLDLHKDCTRLESSLMNSVNYAKSECKSRIYTHPWMSSAIFTSCKQKKTLYKKMRKGLVSENEYKTYHNQLTNLIHARKKQFYSDICNRHKNDIKIIWDHLNQLLGRNSKTILMPFLKILIQTLSITFFLILAHLPSPIWLYLNFTIANILNNNFIRFL